MKIILSLILIIALANAQAQAQEKTKLQAALDIFQSDVTPYLQELVDREYGSEKDEIKTARLHALMLKGLSIKNDVTDALKDKPAPDAQSISKIVSYYYRATYTGLRKQFYDLAEAKVQKL